MGVLGGGFLGGGSGHYCTDLNLWIAAP